MVRQHQGAHRVGPDDRYFDLMMIVDNEDGLVTEFPQNMTSEAAE